MSEETKHSSEKEHSDTQHEGSSAHQTSKPAQHDMHTGMAVICYIPFLFLIPMLSNEKNEPFVKYHIKQGIVFTVTVVFLHIINMMFLYSFFFFGFGFLWGLVDLLLFILFIIGIMHAVNKEQKPLPVVGIFANKINI